MHHIIVCKIIISMIGIINDTVSCGSEEQEHH